MKILALESSATAASVAIVENGALRAQYMQASGLTHSRTLLSMAEDILKNNEMSMSDIDLVAVASGPGSFTGVRIGVAAAKGLAWGADKPVCGVSTLHAMAHHLRDREGIVAAVMDARRGQVYNALFEADGEKLTRLCPDRAIGVEEFKAEMVSSEKKCFLVGDGAVMCYNILKAEGVDVYLAPEPLRFQSAWGVACAAESGEYPSAQDIEPNYLRLSQAERERAEREKNK